MHTSPYHVSDIHTRNRSRIALAGLMTGLALGGYLLLVIAGPPRLPQRLPTLEAIRNVLTGGYLPTEPVVYATVTLAWLLWAWLVFSVGLSLIVAVAELLTRSAVNGALVTHSTVTTWVQGLSRFSERVTAAPVRKLVQTSLPIIIAGKLATSSISASAVVPQPVAPVVTYLGTAPSSGPYRSISNSSLEQRTAQHGMQEYTVRDGDTLWSIAERYYGTGWEYKRLLKANMGHVMRGGERFTNAVIQPGWILEIPPVNRTLDEQAGTRIYTVEWGDTLRGIAARFLGSETRWQEIYEANRASIDDPDEIITGMRLRIPLENGQAATDKRTQSDTRSYVVRSGDTLRGISERFLRDETRWPEIYELNKDRISNPDLIIPGQRLELPRTGLREVDQERADRQTADKERSPKEKKRSTSHEEKSTPTPQRPASPGEPTATPQPEPRSVEPTEVPATPTAAPHTNSPSSRPTEDPTRETGAPESGGTALPVTATPYPATSTPVPVSSQRGEEPTVAPFTVTPSAGPIGEPEGSDIPDPEVSAGAAAVGGALVLGLAGAIALRTVRRRRRSLDEVLGGGVRETLTPTRDAATEPSRIFAHRASGGEREKAAVIAGRVSEYLSEAGIEGTSIISVRQGRDTAEVVLAGSPTEKADLMRLASDLSSRLGTPVQMRETADQDVSLTVGKLRQLVLAPASSAPTRQQTLLLPLGALPQGDPLFVSWEAMEHILVAGGPGSGGDEVLTSVLSALTSRKRPEELELWIVSGRTDLPEGLTQLPHRTGPVVSPSDGEAVRSLLDALCAEVIRRGVSGQVGRQIVLVVGELAELEADSHSLEMLAAYGPSRGVQFLAATSRPQDLPDQRLAYFHTRLCLQMEEEQSIRFLGRPDAVQLSPGEELLLKIGHRASLRIRPYLTDRDELARLVRLMLQEDKGAPPHIARAKVKPAALSHIETAPEPVAESGSTPGPSSTEDTQVIVEAAQEPHQEGASAPPVPHKPVVDERITEDLEEIEYGDTVSTPSGPEETLIESGWDKYLVSIRCLGSLEVMSGERVLSQKLGTRSCDKEWELLAYMASRPGMQVPREWVIEDVFRKPDIVKERRRRERQGLHALPEDELTDMFWTDEYLDKVQNRLRTTIVRLRDLLEFQIGSEFDSTKLVRLERNGTCALDQDLVYSDVHHAEQLVSKLRRSRASETEPILKELRSLFRGDFLSGSRYGWIDATEDGVYTRDYYRRIYEDGTSQLADLYASQGEYKAAIDLYRSLLSGDLNLEPEICPKLYQCYYELGDRAGLEKAHQWLLDELKAMSSEGGSWYAPEHETVRVYRRLLAQLDAEQEHTSGDAPTDRELTGSA